MVINRFLKSSGLSALARWHRVNKIVASLDSLDNRTLEDIGLSRWEIKQRAQQIVDHKSPGTFI